MYDFLLKENRKKGRDISMLTAKKYKHSLFQQLAFYASSSSVASLVIPAEEAAAKCSHLISTTLK